MRKAQKEQAESFITLLEQAHEEIKINIEKNNLEPVLVTLADCQDGAIALGNLIETYEGEGFVTISYLEKYCETVYQIYQSIANGENVDANKIDKMLRKALIAAGNSVRNDIKVRKEVVFFPYKASMWDSLESIYLAAKEDPDCDAYCVPIPYFDKNPDGSFKEMHYEGREYPSNIEIIDWQSYNFEERKPDIIYIHNPYDEFNHVTSVHPRFYASNLTKYTDELIYIPYFVLDEIDPSDQVRIEGMKHFCFLPGTVYADKVILQSENMRQIYINEYMKASGQPDDQSLRKDLEKRFLGLGSPKFDKVLNTKKEDLEIPEEWLKIIEKPDGSWKKIILYNTSVGALLQYDEKMLEKMQSVFATFKENKDEVALLWRPHPLIQATIESMRPQLWAQYKDIVEQYKAEGWGIYDDTTDLDRAVVLSDAYYGDESSVVSLTKKRNIKSVMQNVYLPTHPKNYIAATEAITFSEGKYWYVPYWDNALYCMDGKTYENKRIGNVEEGEGLFSEAISYKNIVIFVPRVANAITIYDKEKKEVRRVEFLKKTESVRGSKFLTAVLNGHYLYLIPCMYHSILCINLQDETFETVRIHEGEQKEVICGGNAIYYHNKILFPCEAEMCIMSFNCENKTISKLYPGNSKNKYTHIFLVEKRIWLIPFNTTDGVSIWNMENNLLEDIIEFPQEVIGIYSSKEIDCLEESVANRYRSNNIRYFNKGYQAGQSIHLSGQMLGKNVVIHTKTREIDSWDIAPKCIQETMYTYLRTLKVATYIQAAGNTLAISGITGEWFKYEKGDWEQIHNKTKKMNRKESEILLDGRRLL